MVETVLSGVADKITYVNNGVELKQRQKTEKEPFSVAVREEIVVLKIIWK